MRIGGIICECNPLHDGHLRLIRSARADGCACLIAVLSDPFTQRGEPALLDARARAEALCRSGVDLVLSLPFPYAAASAEFFARAGVDILSRAGVGELWFGSECGDLSALRAAARATQSDAFRLAYRGSAPNEGRAAAFLSTLQELAGLSFSPSSNDLLGIAYLSAIDELGLPIEPRTLRREGNAYRDERLSPDRLPSATALRAALQAGASPSHLSGLADAARAPLLEAMEQGLAPATLKNAERALLSALRLLDPARADETPELSDGLGRRLISAAAQADSIEQLLARTADKRHTLARVRRGILFALCGVTREDLRSSPPWVRLLAANEKGRAQLAFLRRTGRLSVLTKAADLPPEPAAKRAAELEEAAYALWSLTLPRAATAGEFLRLPPRILK